MSLRPLALPRVAVPLIACLALSMNACDDGSSDDEGTESHAEHGSDTSDGDASVNWHTAPPATATAGEAFNVMFMIDTTGEIHVSEIRICAGAGVAECGLGEMGSFTTVAAMENDEGMYMAEVTLAEAGDYTVVAYAHIGADPHVSEAHNVSVQ